jgi:hypothetical protein
MSDKYIVITTITHTRNTYVVNLDKTGLNSPSTVNIDLLDFANNDNMLCSTELSEDMVGFAIRDYDSVVKHLEATEGGDAADCFEELEDSD